jgi:integrase/recombinase XerD
LENQAKNASMLNRLGTGSNPMTVNNLGAKGLASTGEAALGAEGAAASGANFASRAMPMMSLALMAGSLVQNSRANQQMKQVTSNAEAKEQESEELYDFSKIFERIKIKTPKREPKSLSKEDLRKFKAFLEKLKLRDDFVAVRNLLIIKSILLMGLRESEVKNLKIDDFRVYDGNDSLFEVKIVGKGDKERVVYVKRDLIEDEIDEFKSISDSEYICMTKNKRLMNSDEIFRMVKSAYKRAGIHPDKYNVHSLRHTFAVEFYQKTKDIVVLQRLLGHSDIKTTMIYSHLRQTDISNAVASV